MMSRTVASVFFCVSALSLASAQNLVVNGSFLQGTTGWDSLLVGGPAKAVYSIAGGVYIFKISASGNESWNVQLKQKGIRLTKGDAYHFSFEASAASDRDIEASVGMDNGPYTVYSSPSVPKFRLTTAKNKFDTYFMMDSSGDSTARVQFNCGLAAIDVNLTSVSIEKITAPMIKLLVPSGGEEWSGGTVRDIRWVGVGMQKVSISYSPDAGMTWTAIDEAAPNTGRFSWLVPSVASAWCLVRVLDAGNSLLGDTCAATFETGTFFNLVQNGNFSDSTSAAWNPLGIYGNAAARGSFSNGEYVIAIDSGGSEPWHIQLTQTGVPLVNGETYVFSFEACADAPRPFMTNIGQAGGAYLSYIDDTTKGKISLTATRQTFSIEFVMSQPSDSNARLEFNAGTSTAAVHLDKVSLYRKPAVAIRHGQRQMVPNGPDEFTAAFGLAGVNRTYAVRLKGLPRQAVVIDLRGKIVRILSPYGQNFLWDGRSSRGALVCPGAYVVQMLGERGSAAIPVVLPVR
jgi:hypothetical protein